MWSMTAAVSPVAGGVMGHRDGGGLDSYSMLSVHQPDKQRDNFLLVFCNVTFSIFCVDTAARRHGTISTISCSKDS